MDEKPAAVASLPVRECGLKLDLTILQLTVIGSLPVRECGLKSEMLNDGCTISSSLPVRECGLKFCCAGCPVLRFGVTPRAGVWIEMLEIDKGPDGVLVTPRAGVWIEMVLHKS